MQRHDHDPDDRSIEDSEQRLFREVLTVARLCGGPVDLLDCARREGVHDATARRYADVWADDGLVEREGGGQVRVTPEGRAGGGLA